jgi:ABC-type dipeptide/oligopeptide/nickel transport system ATPase subunit
MAPRPLCEACRSRPDEARLSPSRARAGVVSPHCSMSVPGCCDRIPVEWRSSALISGQGTRRHWHGCDDGRWESSCSTGNWFRNMSLLDNVALPLVLEGRKRVDAEETASLWLARVGLADVQTAIPGQVSGGQAQRAAIARALVTTPMVVFADEPLASLDSQGADEMLQLLLDHVRDYRTTLVFVTHDNTVVARADREIRLRDGVVEYQVDLE